ncbi:MAG: hypothetical protein M1391_17535, partial [Bacteroidetes bacterium]|nr:hypothetical protein [Bacteroidota bacterium]
MFPPGTKSLFLIAFFITAGITYSQAELKKEFYPNGKLKSEGTYLNGVHNGIYREYYESGKLWKEWNFQNGKEEGLSTWYFENG